MVHPYRHRNTVWCFSTVLLLLLLCLSTTEFFHPPVVSALSIFSGKSNDLYAVLGVPRSSSQGEIKKAFRRLTMANHPDLKETFEEKDEAKKKMIPILAAYEILSNEERREEYDRTGVLFGTKTPPPEDFTTLQQLFQYYHMNAPIISKTPTMESARTLQKVLDYRGPKLFLIQVFSDEVAVSRAFSTVWETVARSPLVAAGLVELYRIDADSFAGASMTKKLNIHLKPSSKWIPLFVVLDGQRMDFSADSSHGDVPVEEDVLEFVYSFFDEAAQAVGKNSVYSIPALKERVALPLSAFRPIRLLMPSSVSDGLLTAVHLRFPQVELIPTSRAVLRQFAEVECGYPLTMEGHFGEIISAPHFLVALTAPLSLVPSNHTAVNATRTPSVPDDDPRPHRADTEHTASLFSNASSVRDLCPSMQIGLSLFLTYDKVVSFLNDLLPPVHPEMGSITPADNMNFIHLCKGDCLLYFQPYCTNSSSPSDGIPSPREVSATGEASVRDRQATPPHVTAKAVELLKRPYPDISVGYICVNAHPRLQRALSASIVPPHPLAISDHSTDVGKTTIMGEPFFALLLHGDDTRLFPILSPASISFSNASAAPHVMALTPSIIDTAIAALLLADVGNEVDGKKDSAFTPDSSVSHVISLKDAKGASIGVGNLLHTTPFRITPKQRYSIIATHFIRQVRPFLYSSFPFFMMFLVHRFYFNRTPKAVRPVNRTGKTMGAVFDDDDLDNALEEKGFLILVADKRPAGSGQLTLPSIASDARFVVRALGPEHAKWKNWIEREKKKHAASSVAPQPQGKENSVGESAADTASHAASAIHVEKNPHADLSVLAIRQTKMTGATKSDEQSVESFLYDLLDGTIPTTLPVPYKALL